MAIKEKNKPKASIKAKPKKKVVKKVEEPTYTYQRPQQKFDANGRCLCVNVQQYTECCLDCGRNIWGG